MRAHRSAPVVALIAAAFTAACGTSKNQSASAGASAAAVDTAATPMSKNAPNAQMTEHAADSAQSVGIPTAIADVGNHGEDLYDQIKASNWTRARIIMDSLDTSAKALSAGEHAQLAGVLDTLRRAITNHQRQTAIVAANRVTFLDAKLTEAYHPKMPADVVRLDYYGRELEIWAAQKNMAKLASTSTDLQQTWARVKPLELSHGGAAAAARTDSLVARIAAARTPAEYSKVATPFLDVVDLLEKPFQ